MADIGRFSDISTALVRVRILLTDSAQRRCGVVIGSRCFRFNEWERALNREELMAQESVQESVAVSFQEFVVESAIAAPDIPAVSLAPNEVVPLLIGSTVGEVERELVLQTLARCDGNRTRASRVLGVSVRTLRNKIRLYSADGIDVPPHLE
jgi:DNA-binding NtrC family response regulator